jgi:hypothetical protein
MDGKNKGILPSRKIIIGLNRAKFLQVEKHNRRISLALAKF